MKASFLLFDQIVAEGIQNIMSEKSLDTISKLTIKKFMDNVQSETKHIAEEVKELQGKFASATTDEEKDAITKEIMTIGDVEIDVKSMKMNERSPILQLLSAGQIKSMETAGIIEIEYLDETLK